MLLTSERLKQDFKTPFLYIDKELSQIDARSESYIICGKSLVQNAYSNVLFVDSNGRSFLIASVTPKRFLLLASLKYFAHIIEVEPVIKGEVQVLPLEKLKAVIIETIERKPLEWSSMGTIEELKEQISACQSYHEVMRFFNSRV